MVLEDELPPEEDEVPGKLELDSPLDEEVLFGGGMNLSLDRELLSSEELPEDDSGLPNELPLDHEPSDECEEESSLESELEDENGLELEELGAELDDWNASLGSVEPIGKCGFEFYLSALAGGETGKCARYELIMRMTSVDM
jgi:hypothetical protein